MKNTHYKVLITPNIKTNYKSLNFHINIHLVLLEFLENQGWPTTY